MRPGLFGAIGLEEEQGLLDPYQRPEPGPLAGLLGDPVMKRMNDARLAKQGRWDAGERSPTPLTEDNMWLADDVAGSFVGPLGAAGIFAGVGARTANRGALEAAERLAREGADPRTIWRETGWFQGPDAKWRWEIDDQKSRLTEARRSPREAYEDFRRDALVNDDALSRRFAEEVKPAVDLRADEVLRYNEDVYRRASQLAQSGEIEKAKQILAENPYSTAASAVRFRQYGPASAYMDHSELARSYPDVAHMHTRIDDGMSDFAGKYLPAAPGRGEQIALGQNPQTQRDRGTMLHEMQHAVQRREAFERGGMPSQFDSPGNAEKMREALQWRKEVNKKAQQMPGADRLAVENALIEDYRQLGALDMLPDRISRDIANQPMFSTPEGIAEAESIVRQYGLDRRVTPYSPSEAYRRLYGEAEARAVETRADLTPAQRRERFPMDDFDVPAEELIVRGADVDPEFRRLWLQGLGR